MFRGLHDTTIDSKGRTSMPVRFREVLAQQDLAAALKEVEARIEAEGKARVAQEAQAAQADQADQAGVCEPEEGPESEDDVEVVEVSGEEEAPVVEAAPEESEPEPEEPQETRFVVTTAIDPCLVVYSMREWEAFEAKLATLPQFDRAVINLKRVYVAGATECTLDKHGRLMIPPMLREHMGLEKDVVWAGMVQTVEIWAKERWLIERTQVACADREKITEKLTELGL